jgi:hypothetical protein
MEFFLCGTGSALWCNHQHRRLHDVPRCVAQARLNNMVSFQHAAEEEGTRSRQ